jgi:hypothetical protein
MAPSLTPIHPTSGNVNSPKFAKKGSNITHLGDAPGSDACYIVGALVDPAGLFSPRPL